MLHSFISPEGKTLAGGVGKKLGGQLLELKNREERNGKTGLNPWKDVAIYLDNVRRSRDPAKAKKIEF